MSRSCQLFKSIGVPQNLINVSTVGNGKGDGGKHWRIEPNSSKCVVINNKTDGKNVIALNINGIQTYADRWTFEIDKYDENGELAGKSSVDN